MLSKKLNIAVWIVIASLAIIFILKSNFNTYSSNENKGSLTKKNMQKVKLGMTYKEVRSALGSPTVILFLTTKELEKYKKMDPKKLPIYIFETDRDSRTKSGEIDWLYVLNDRNSLEFGYPVYSFNLGTNRLARVSRRFYDGS
jgi:hypothetical protein